MSKKKIGFIVLGLLGTIVVLGGIFWIGFATGWNSGTNFPKTITVAGASNISSGSSSTDADFGVFWQAWQNINDLYLRNQSTTNSAKVQGAIKGLVDSLGDPYSEFFSPTETKQFQQDITGDFGGIGTQLGVATSGQILIIAPLAGSPAEKAGLKSKDQLLGINGTSTDGMTLTQAVDLIRGPEGTSVTLTIFRTGWDKPKDFKIVRQKIMVPTVDFEMKGTIAHISLHEFTQDAAGSFYDALQKAVNNNAQGIVLDLRDDPGGYLEVAVNLAGYFLKPDTLVVKEVGRAVPEVDSKSEGNGALADVPMAVLINGGSASAAEILAGALHDDRNVPLVGEKSFGKGTVQELEQLSDGSAIKLTIAHWVLPSGKILDHDGLMPDYPVSMTDADALNHKDPQLDKALQVVHSEIGK